ncbi:aa3-type cytochrome c oxidase subunit IV [Roseomonas eburnea]|uniref:Aa3-type cytochrome c oxidase subunit IV n=1 Tax=Neoroseomonas eburnea TaxID=1346889 RepID=A0A9X9X7S3_9PROT|nr:aa3-type cytochrome c oxidase subunit IV [Neoroseomonas eburnea]MBR0679759.1 aa3-type cytochrome c oxidase subunit IV [Neoroseomonas eburnea]
MAEQQTYEFVEVKAGDILAERQQSWAGFTSFVTYSVVAIAVLLVGIYVFWG